VGLTRALVWREVSLPLEASVAQRRQVWAEWGFPGSPMGDYLPMTEVTWERQRPGPGELPH
jgi:hypothetical protein